jgi:hypothetical protein
MQVFMWKLTKLHYIFDGKDSTNIKLHLNSFKIQFWCFISNIIKEYRVWFQKPWISLQYIMCVCVCTHSLVLSLSLSSCLSSRKNHLYPFNNELSCSNLLKMKTEWEGELATNDLIFEVLLPHVLFAPNICVTFLCFFPTNLSWI